MNLSEGTNLYILFGIFFSAPLCDTQRRQNLINNYVTVRFNEGSKIVLLLLVYRRRMKRLGTDF